ncbi:MAG: hypothetical protein ACI83W_001010 [Marinoscillum sp.]|jgi:hypothetical protein
MKRILFTVGILVLGNVAFSQSIANTGGITYLYKNDADPKTPDKPGFYVGPHVLGDTITSLMNALEKSYVYYVETEGAYSTEEKKIYKPSIYMAAKRINKKLEKDIKKDKIEPEAAYPILKHTLLVAIKLKNYNTEIVERELKSIKDLDELVDYFNDIKFKS